MGAWFKAGAVVTGPNLRADQFCRFEMEAQHFCQNDQFKVSKAVFLFYKCTPENFLKSFKAYDYARWTRRRGGEVEQPIESDAVVPITAFLF